MCYFTEDNNYTLNLYIKYVSAMYRHIAHKNYIYFHTYNIRIYYYF